MIILFIDELYFIRTIYLLSVLLANKGNQRFKSVYQLNVLNLIY